MRKSLITEQVRGSNYVEMVKGHDEEKLLII